MKAKCEVKKCKRIMDLVYYGSSICEDCWAKHCDENDKFDLKKIFKIFSKGK